MTPFAPLMLALTMQATPMQATPTAGRAEDQRLLDVGHRLAIAGVPLCAARQPVAGMLLHHLGEYAPADQPSTIAEFALDRGPGVIAVAAGGAAVRAGMQPGDTILSVNGVRLVYGPGDARRAIEALETNLDGALRKGPVSLVILRDRQELRKALVPQSGCAAHIRLARSTQLNAFANRGYAILTTAMLNFVASDDELAVVLGHEMAHVILGHAPPGVESRSRSRANEIAADRLGLRLAARAGYDIRAAIPFWDRYSKKTGATGRRNHPRIAERQRIVRETLSNLSAKAP